MSDPRLQLVTAEANATAARARLSDTVSRLQARLDPQLLADEARQVGLSAARAGINGARRNPSLVVGALAAAGVLLARRRIVALFRRTPPNTAVKDDPS